jgi:hypothetical protein
MKDGLLDRSHRFVNKNIFKKSAASQFTILKKRETIERKREREKERGTSL